MPTFELKPTGSTNAPRNGMGGALLRPGAATYAVHFAWLRPAPNMQLSPTYYARFFRFLLGSGVDTERADAAVANLGRQ